MGDACPSAAVGASDLQPTPASHLAACLQRNQPLSGPPLCPLAVGTFPRASGPYCWPSCHFWSPIQGLQPRKVRGADSNPPPLGASEPRNMIYMSRLGIWGEGTPFRTFEEFLHAIEKRCALHAHVMEVGPQRALLVICGGVPLPPTLLWQPGGS